MGARRGRGRETDVKETGGLTAEEILLMDDETLNQVRRSAVGSG